MKKIHLLIVFLLIVSVPGILNRSQLISDKTAKLMPGSDRMMYPFTPIKLPAMPGSCIVIDGDFFFKPWLSPADGVHL